MSWSPWNFSARGELVTRIFHCDLKTLAWRLAGGLILFVVCALCAHSAEPMPYIPWLPPPPGPCDSKVFITEMPQFEPNLVTPPGLNAIYSPTSNNNQNTADTSTGSGSIGSGISSGMGNTVIERDRSGEVVGTPVTSTGVLSSPVGAVQNQWLDDKQLSHQWAPPKVDAMFLNAGHNCVDPSFCPKPPPTYPPFGLEVDGILLHRNRANLAAYNNAFGIAPTSSEQVDLGGGGRVRFVFLGIDNHDFEVLYFGTDAWDAPQTFTDFLGNPQQIFFSSQLFNWEVNFRQRSKSYEWLTWLYGVRYIEFSEDFDRSVNLGGPLGGASLNVGADNYLYGAQLGVELLLWQPSERWKFEAYAKSGAYINNASNAATYSIFSVQLPNSTRNHFGAASFVGDLGLNATWNIHRQCGIRAGYQYTVIDNVAMAPDALYDDSRTHTLTVHGGYVGCEIRW
jgi:hypothetical protein